MMSLCCQMFWFYASKYGNDSRDDLYATNSLDLEHSVQYYVIWSFWASRYGDNLLTNANDLPGKMDLILCLWILCHFKLNVWLNFLMWTHFMYEISALIFSGRISEDNPWTIWILKFKSSTHGSFVGICTIWIRLISYLWICIGRLLIEIPSS